LGSGEADGGRGRPTEGGGRPTEGEADGFPGGGGQRATVPAADGGGGSEGCLRLRLGLGLGGLQSATRPIQVPSRPHPHPHRLLRPPQRTKAPQDAKSAPRGRHGAMADAIHAGAVASPWREPEKRHGDMATIWRRYSDALTTMFVTLLKQKAEIHLSLCWIV